MGYMLPACRVWEYGGIVVFKGGAVLVGIGGTVVFNSSEGGLGKPEIPDGVAENGRPQAVKG